MPTLQTLYEVFKGLTALCKAFDALSFKSALCNDAETHLLTAQILSLTINPKNGRKVLLKVRCVELSDELWQSEC